MKELTKRTRLAHADAWQAIGLIHAEKGRGRVGHTPGALLMASGLPHPQYNNVDVLDATRVDIGWVVKWYADQGLPWGARAPADETWSAGRHLFRKRLMALPSRPPGHTDRQRRNAHHSGSARRAGRSGCSRRLRLRRHGRGPDSLARTLVASDRAIVALASWNGVPAGTGYAVLSDGSAGEATYVAGIGVDPAFRMRGVGTALSAWLIQQSGTDRMAHLHPDSNSAARIYGRLGFVEVPGFDVYVDIE